MPLRTLSRIAPFTGLLVVLLAHGPARFDALVSSVRAEPPKETSANVSPVASAETSSSAGASKTPEVQGFDILPTFSYGVATSRVFGIEMDPYAVTFGLETGYTWKSGPRLGLYCHYGLGRTESQIYTPRFGEPSDVENEASGLVAGLSLGYDLPLHFLVLRYTLGFGMSWMKWDFGKLPVLPLGEFKRDSGKEYGFHVTPGLTVLWPIRVFEVGLGFDYVIQTADAIPPGILAKLLLGVKL